MVPLYKFVLHVSDLCIYMWVNMRWFATAHALSRAFAHFMHTNTNPNFIAVFQFAKKLIVHSCRGRAQNENKKQRINCEKNLHFAEMLLESAKTYMAKLHFINILFLRFAYKKKKLKCCTKMIFLFRLTQRKVRINDETCFFFFACLFLGILGSSYAFNSLCVSIWK